MVGPTAGPLGILFGRANAILNNCIISRRPAIRARLRPHSCDRRCDQRHRPRRARCASGTSSDDRRRAASIACARRPRVRRRRREDSGRRPRRQSRKSRRQCSRLSKTCQRTRPSSGFLDVSCGAVKGRCWFAKSRCRQRPSVNGETNVTSIIATLFWLSVAIIAYAYVLYPLVVWSLSRLFGRAPRCEDLPNNRLPFVSGPDRRSQRRGRHRRTHGQRAGARLGHWAGDRHRVRRQQRSTASIARRSPARACGFSSRRHVEAKQQCSTQRFRRSRGHRVAVRRQHVHRAAGTAQAGAVVCAIPRTGVVCGRLVLMSSRPAATSMDCIWQSRNVPEALRSTSGRTAWRERRDFRRAPVVVHGHPPRHDRRRLRHSPEDPASDRLHVRLRRRRCGVRRQCARSRL